MKMHMEGNNVIGYFAILLVLVLTSRAQQGGPPAPCENGCSGNGICGQDGACSCHDDYAGSDCSVRLANDFPTIFVSHGHGMQGDPITVQFSAWRPLRRGNEGLLTIEIWDVDVPGIVFDKGRKDGDVIVITSQEFGEVTVSPPSDYSGMLNFKSAAVFTLGALTLRSPERLVSIGLRYKPKSPLFLDAEHGEGVMNRPISFNVTAGLPPRLLAMAEFTIYIRDIYPVGTTFSKGEQLDDQWAMEEKDFRGIQIFTPMDFHGNVTFTVLAFAAMDGSSLSRERHFVIPVATGTENLVISVNSTRTCRPLAMVLFFVPHC